MSISTISTSLRDIIDTLQSNPILPLIASGGITVWLISNLKIIISAIWSFFISLISFTIFNTYEDNRANGRSVQNRQNVFNTILSKSTPLWERCKNLDLSNVKSRIDYDDYGNVVDTIPASDDMTYGFSIRLFLGKLIIVTREYQSQSQKIVVNTNIRVFFAFKDKFMRRLTSMIGKSYLEQTNIVKSTINVFYGNKYEPFIKNKRELSSIFTNDNEHIELYNDIKKFIDNKELYVKMNYPYKYSAILHGVPGSGKSSTILAIASALNRNVHYINLKNQDAGSLLDFIGSNTDSKIFVFEDIDALSSGVAENRENEKKPSEFESVIKEMSPTSLSDLLNIMDGLLSSDGSICIFTTNHLDKLDPALLRAGRMNKMIEFKYLNSMTASKMVKRYLDIDIDGLKDGIKPAELQDAILDILTNNASMSCLDKFKI